MNKLPNLFIVGAKKAATTFLAQNLARHPDIFAPPIKEPQFFSTNIMPKTNFGDQKSRRHYLNFQEGAKEFYRFNPSSKIITMNQVINFSNKKIYQNHIGYFHKDMRNRSFLLSKILLYQFDTGKNNEYFIHQYRL